MADIRKLKDESRKLYKNIGSVQCPILDTIVDFTSEGFNHLLYETNRQPRKIGEQYMKLKCLSHAQQVVQDCEKITHTRVVRLKDKGKWKKATQYGLMHEVEPGKKIRVVIQRIDRGSYKFLSIMPHNNSSKPPRKPKSTR